MTTLTICYSTHRPETLQLTSRKMAEHEVIILEEPPHPDFISVLSGESNLEEHLLDLDIEYPDFTKKQYTILQDLYDNKKIILQIEPYYEHLYQIQLFFADGHSPSEIKPNTVASRVYNAERYATKQLIDFYNASRTSDFFAILNSMNEFAKADAARFVVRDKLRVDQIVRSLKQNKTTYVEAGSLHLYLFRLLGQQLSKDWKLKMYSVDRAIVKRLERKGNLLNPGDILTLHYIWGNNVEKKKWALYCAQALIYNKIVIKEEITETDALYPHTSNDLDSISAVRRLSLQACQTIYQHIRPLPTNEAAEFVHKYLEI